MRIAWLAGALVLAGACGLAAEELPALYDADGKTAETARFFGKKHRVLLFAGIASPAEQAMLDLVQENLKRIRHAESAAVAVVFVAMTPRQADDYCRAREYGFPWLCDPSAAWLEPLRIDFLPTLVVQAPGGAETFRTTALSEELIRAVVRHPETRPAAK